MNKTKTAMAAAFALGVATLLLPADARAMPLDNLAGAAASTGVVQDVRWVCGPFRCWWRPNYYAYAPGFYVGPRRFYRYGHGPRFYHRRSW
jgi:hypothetical protein